MAAQPGWYPDPNGAPQLRYWDGQQWTEALAAPTIIYIQPPQPRAALGWTQRHPVWATTAAFWIACMAWQWHWLVPVAAIAAAAIWTVRRHRLRHAQLAADADAQDDLALAGDARGIYGHFPPAVSDSKQHLIDNDSSSGPS